MHTDVARHVDSPSLPPHWQCALGASLRAQAEEDARLVSSAVFDSFIELVLTYICLSGSARLR